MSVLYFKMMFPNSSVIAFEPSLEVFECLKKNVQDNKLSKTEVYNLALSDEDGEATFFYDMRSPGALSMSLVSERMPKEERKVTIKRLSEFINKRVDFLKIDIEGAEFNVFKELESSGKLNLIDRMMIEYHHHIKPDENRMGDFLKILENAGFSYQIKSAFARNQPEPYFQDIMISAFKKKGTL